MVESAAQIHPRGNVEIDERRQTQKGDTAVGFEEADTVIEKKYRVPVQPTRHWKHTALWRNGKGKN